MNIKKKLWVPVRLPDYGSGAELKHRFHFGTVFQPRLDLNERPMIMIQCQSFLLAYLSTICSPLAALLRDSIMLLYQDGCSKEHVSLLESGNEKKLPLGSIKYL